MISNETKEIIEQETRTLFQKLEEPVQALALKEAEGSIVVEITMEEPQIFIGENGQTLAELQHILRQLLRKKFAEPLWVGLDINGYKKSREEYVQELANSAANDVVLLKKEKELPVMTAAERRIVHMTLSQRTDVVAESVGEDPNRRIVIRPKAGFEAP